MQFGAPEADQVAAGQAKQEPPATEYVMAGQAVAREREAGLRTQTHTQQTQTQNISIRWQVLLFRVTPSSIPPAPSPGGERLANSTVVCVDVATKLTVYVVHTELPFCVPSALHVFNTTPSTDTWIVLLGCCARSRGKSKPKHIRR